MNTQIAKPIVNIINAVVSKYKETDIDVLKGTPVDHPRKELNVSTFRSSKILSITVNQVETINTIYKVVNWVTLPKFSVEGALEEDLEPSKLGGYTIEEFQFDESDFKELSNFK